mmetsp:Transcript_9439/g.27105  ORF Transcript_9439/g.27105 Transcript_9439/m.27105 type:complete len:208 (+) Transcript_9439:2-625(+)
MTNKIFCIRRCQPPPRVNRANGCLASCKRYKKVRRGPIMKTRKMMMISWVIWPIVIAKEVDELARNYSTHWGIPISKWMPMVFWVEPMIRNLARDKNLVDSMPINNKLPRMEKTVLLLLLVARKMVALPSQPPEAPMAWPWRMISINEMCKQNMKNWIMMPMNNLMMMMLMSVKQRLSWKDRDLPTTMMRMIWMTMNWMTNLLVPKV